MAINKDQLEIKASEDEERGCQNVSTRFGT